MQGESIDRTYMTSLTKTKAAKYDSPRIEDKEIDVRRSDQELYKFMKGDFPRLHLNDIEDMPFLIDHNRLFNLKGEDIVHLVAALSTPFLPSGAASSQPPPPVTPRHTPIITFLSISTSPPYATITPQTQHLDLHIPPTPPHATAAHLHHTSPQIHHRVSTPSPHRGPAANATPPPHPSHHRRHHKRVHMVLSSAAKGALDLSIAHQGLFGFDCKPPAATTMGVFVWVFHQI
nr:hypothetical protein [Tanacetum cinerariifolium]